MATNCKMKQVDVEELIRRFRTLRTVYNECARAIDIHCHQVTFWSENVVPKMSEDELSLQTSLDRDSLLPSTATRRHLLLLLNHLKNDLSEYYQRLLALKKPFDKLYYANTDRKDMEGADELREGYCAIDEELCGLKGVRFVPCDSLLWEPMEGALGTLDEFTIEVHDPLGEPDKVIDCPPHSIIKSPVSLIRTIFKRPLSAFSISSRDPKTLYKSQSVPKLHQF